MIWEGIIGLCNSNAAITNELTPEPVFGGDLRMYPVKLPQGLKLFPAVAGKVVSNVSTTDFSGDDDQFDFVAYDFHCYARKMKDAQAIAKLLRTELTGASGTFNGIEFNDVRFSDSGSDDYLEDLELYTYSIEINFNVRG